MSHPLRPSRRRFLLRCGTALAAAGPLRRLQAAEPQVPTVDERIRRLAEEAPLALEFRGTAAEECRQWQVTFAAKLRSLLGPHQPPAHWRTAVERRVELPDHHREELVLTAEGHPPLPVYLLLPNTPATGRRAGVVALHGHSGAISATTWSSDVRTGPVSRRRSRSVATTTGGSWSAGDTWLRCPA